MTRRSVVVVGGGVAGLAAAWEASGANGSTVAVTVLEANDHVGGALQTGELNGELVDLGADGFLSNRPEAIDFIREVGMGDSLLPIAASGASIYLRRGLEPVPAGLVLGVPTYYRQVRQLRGLSRAARRGALRDRVVPRRITMGDDVTIGAILRGKFGDALVDELIEPMIGGIQAGRVDDLSAAAVFPALLAAAQRGGSLMKAIRPQPAPTPVVPSPLFSSLVGGVGSLPPFIAERLRERGVRIATDSKVTRLRPTPQDEYPWAVETDTTVTPADVVILACPPHIAGALARQHVDAAKRLVDMQSASTSMITFAVASRDVTLPAHGTGVLVPLGTPFSEGTDSLLTTAVTFLNRKWPSRTTSDVELVRVHVGRSDDDRGTRLSNDELTRRVRAELRQLFGAWPNNGPSRVQRWPSALPQYRLDHERLVDDVRAAGDRHNLLFAGMAYDGVGIPASIASGRRAGTQARDTVTRT